MKSLLFIKIDFDLRFNQKLTIQSLCLSLLNDVT